MGTFKRREPQVEAVQFKGGLEDAENVIGWLHVRGYEAAYQPEMLNDGQLVRREGVVYWQRQYIAANTRPPVETIRPNMWAISDPESSMHALTDGEFTMYYKEVLDEDARPV